MTSYERVKCALAFSPVDKVPLEYHPCRRGLYEHGEALRGMIKQLPGDFTDYSDLPIPKIPLGDYDADGRYHAFKTDEWRVEWEYRIFEMAGHPSRQPIQELSQVAGYNPPPCAYLKPEAFAQLKSDIQITNQNGYSKMGWIGFFEKLCALRNFEDVLMDIYDDAPEINLLADKIIDAMGQEVECYIRAGARGIQLADDFGTNQALLVSPQRWREFFKPRYKKLIEPIKAAGLDVFFHTCGNSREILPDLKELGVDAIWPQLSVYPPTEAFAAYLRELQLACAIHIDRACVMTHGSPQEVTEAVHRTAKAFDMTRGGAWFYVETDNGFPLQNIEALLAAIAQYRSCN